MPTEFLTRTEFDDLHHHAGQKVADLQDRVRELEETIEIFRTWSVIEASKVRQLTTWLLPLLTDEQREVIGTPITPEQLTSIVASDLVERASKTEL